jgi:hypothetical protein
MTYGDEQAVVGDHVEDLTARALVERHGETIEATWLSASGAWPSLAPEHHPRQRAFPLLAALQE